ncbi:MAG TPA: FkbM family methyltransferase [Polyangiales bacterium]|nr:FkbM family methyltransferase [Polyangiales bacterium]
MSLAPGSILVNGEYGLFEGAQADRVVMHEYATLGFWAKTLVTLVERLFSDGPGTFIDVGANIGLVVVPVVERSGSIGIAFEPEPRNFGYLTRNIARHGLLDQIECHALACYSEPARLALALSSDNLGDHRLQPKTAGTGSRSQAQIEVASVRLDDVLRGRELPRPIVLKLDTQGSEVRVLEGARETLARADYIISEYWPRGIVAHGDATERFAEIMRGFPFGAVLHLLPLPEPLHSSEHVFSQLSWIKQDGSDPGFFDLLFARHWVLPGSAPELDELKRAWEAHVHG